MAVFNDNPPTKKAKASFRVWLSFKSPSICKEVKEAVQAVSVASSTYIIL